MPNSGRQALLTCILDIGRPESKRPIAGGATGLTENEQQLGRRSAVTLGDKTLWEEEKGFHLPKRSGRRRSASLVLSYTGKSHIS
jgi:hypothetical protein